MIEDRFFRNVGKERDMEKKKTKIQKLFYPLQTWMLL